MHKSGIPRLTEMLSREDLALITSVAVRRKYRDGEIVHERGDRLPAAGVVIAGQLKLSYPRSDGREVFSGFIHTGQNYGDAALVQARDRAHRAVAVGETVIDHLDERAFVRLMDRPEIVRALYRVASYRLSVVLGLLDDMRMLPPEVRLAKLILNMARAADDERLPFLQEEFAGMLGVSTVTLAKALRRLGGLGLVETGYRQIRVNDRDRLAAWVQEQDPAD